MRVVLPIFDFVADYANIPDASVFKSLARGVGIIANEIGTGVV